MNVIKGSKLFKHLIKAVRIAAWAAIVVVLLFAEVCVFERWGCHLGVRIFGLFIHIGAIALMGLGFYRLKVAVENDQVSYWPGMRDCCLGVVLSTGITLGTHLHYATWYVPPSVVIKNGF